VTAGGMERVLDGEAVWPPPLWLMRQAGRYLPEYKALRGRAADFLAFCYDPAMATEATLQPIRRFGFDAAIIFSDILVVPDALGREVRFTQGEGPAMRPITDPAEIEALPEVADSSRLAPTVEAIRRVRGALPRETALLGFCGAPWTVATYMIAGRGTPDQAPARLFAYLEPAAFQRLIDRIVAVSAAYLVEQLRAGASAVQIFDSWAGVLPPDEFQRWSMDPIEDLILAVRREVPEARIIAFPRGASADLLAEAHRRWHAAALSLDTTADIVQVRSVVGSNVALQGNIDPLALMAGGKALDMAIDRVLRDAEGAPFIGNLGHGILQHTPIAHVEHLVARFRAA